jgi:hypothetical protein
MALKQITSTTIDQKVVNLAAEKLSIQESIKTLTAQRIKLDDQHRAAINRLNEIIALEKAIEELRS